MSKLETRAKIFHLQEKLMELPEGSLIDTDELVEHIFAEGFYIRRMFIPKGVVIVGKIHKTRHVSIISCGRIAVITENDEQVFEGPYIFINEPGDKRTVYALEDTVWATIHPTEETDLEEIEKEVIAKDYSELIGYEKPLQLEENTT